MYENATIPGLPSRLWQAAFFMDLTRRFPAFRGSEESRCSAAGLLGQCPEIVDRRKAVARAPRDQ